MKPWLWTTLCLGCLALAGCRANSSQTSLEQESRQWEDRFYVVKDRLDQCQAELHDARQRNREMGGDVGGPSPSDLHDALIFPGLRRKSTKGKSAALAPPNIEGLSPDRFQKVAPESLGPPTPPNATPPSGPVDPDSLAPPFEPAAGKKPHRLQDPLLPPDTELLPPGDESPPKPEIKRGSNLSGDSSEVARIELIGMATDGYDSDGRPGDEGVRFVLQPRDANGKTLDAAAPISIVVVDPSPQGKPVRLARWDLTPQQAAGYHQHSPRGFHLRLPWPGATPKHSRLRLFARYTTTDGRKVQAEKAITVALGGKQPPNWSIDPPPELPPQAQPRPERPRVAAQPQQSKPRRKRPLWSPDRK